MTKRIFTLALALALAVALAAGCLAADDGTVNYKGGDQLDCNGGMDGFENMLPGVEYSDTITLTNSSNKAANFYMNTDVLQTLAPQTRAGGVQTGYTVALTCGGNVLYGYNPAQDAAPTGALLGGSGTQGLEELNQALQAGQGQYQLVATLQPGESTQVRLAIQADGTATGNYFQGSNGQIRFQFQASEITPQTRTEVRTEKREAKVVTQVRYLVQAVQTGDSSLVALCGGVMVLALLLFALLGKKKDKQEKGSGPHA